MAAASSVLDVMLAEDFLPQVLEKGQYLQTALQKALAENAKVTDIRGLVCMMGIETTENLTDLVSQGREQGLNVLTAGSNVIRLLPPLTLTKEKIDEGVAILTDIFD